MSTHACIRCGLESRCTHGTWPDRHPLAAVLFAVPVAIVGLGAIVAYPWLLAVIAAGIAAYLVDREHRRRQALAARADWEHHRLIARPSAPFFPAPGKRQVEAPVRATYARGTRSATVTPRRPANPAPWHLVTQLPTQPMHAGRN